MGVCCECKEKAAAGRNLCPKHLARNVANVAKSKAKRMALSRMREENLHTKTITHDTQEDPSNLDYPT